MLFMLCLASILLSRPYVVCVCGRVAVATGLSLVFEVGGVGFISRRICWGLHPLSLKIVFLNHWTYV